MVLTMGSNGTKGTCRYMKEPIQQDRQNQSKGAHITIARNTCWLFFSCQELSPILTVVMKVHHFSKYALLPEIDRRGIP